MTAFRAGDRVLVEGQLVWVDGNGAGLSFPDWGGHCVFVSLDLLHPVPEPPYVDPELVPGMVVMSKDRSDVRRWWVARDDTSPHYGDRPFRFLTPDGLLTALPDEIRVVFDPRKATS